MNILKKCMHFIRPCLNQLDDYQYIKGIDNFQMLMLEKTRGSSICFNNCSFSYAHAQIN